MRLSKFLLLGVALASVACSDDDNGAGPRGPTALVRVVNVSPDAGTINFRFVDELENLPTFVNIPFRGSTGFYQRVEAGDRDVRVFFNTANVDSATIRLIDETITLAADQHYTIYYRGSAAGNTDELLVVEETVPADAPASQIGVRVRHAAPAVGAVDVYAADTALNPITTPEAEWLDIAFDEATAYQNLATVGATTLYEFAVADAGAAAASFSASPNVPGTPATSTISAGAGVRQAGSMLTALIVPGATPGSRAATTNSSGTQTNANPTVVILIDNIPGT
jgi:hypothetical protein